MHQNDYEELTDKHINPHRPKSQVTRTEIIGTINSEGKCASYGVKIYHDRCLIQSCKLLYCWTTTDAIVYQIHFLPTAYAASCTVDIESVNCLRKLRIQFLTALMHKTEHNVHIRSVFLVELLFVDVNSEKYGAEYSHTRLSFLFNERGKPSLA